MPLEPSRIGEILKAANGVRVVVVGDLMLDRYESGEAVRLSPEAPVPVLKKMHQRDVPGGAANVAMNVKALGGSALVIGVVGKDPESGVLAGLLDDGGIEHRLLAESNRPTTLKTRFTHGGQQFLRLDREITDHLESASVDNVIASLERALYVCDCVVFSDYAKGFFSPGMTAEMVRMIQGGGVPLVVDPKPSNPYLCNGCTVFMPNRREGAALAAMSAEGAGRDIAGSLLWKYHSDVLLTDGSNGMFLAMNGREVVHIKSSAREVFDVSGAGDTVAAAVALGLGSGCDLFEASVLANRAAGVSVSKLGTATVNPEEVALGAAPVRRILARAELAGTVAELQHAGKRVVFTNGCFDLLHVGHIKYLQAARALGDALVVGLNTDSSVRRLKGPERPLIGEGQRAELLAALESVDYVTLFDEDTPVLLIELLKPDIFVKGGDYTEEMLPEAPVVKSYGGTVEIVDVFGDGISTSEIIERIESRGEADE